MATQVWLIRHAETAAPTVFHGAESDIGLSDRGARRAAAIGPYLAPLNPYAIVTSGMRRAINTATPIARVSGLPLFIELSFHERGVGILSGTPTVPEGPLWRQTASNWANGNLDFTTEGGESFVDVQKRVLPAWERLTDEFADKRLIVVAHGMVIKILLLTILPEWSHSRWKEFPSIANLAVSALCREGKRPWQATQLCEVPECVLAID